jgi:ferredoxin
LTRGKGAPRIILKRTDKRESAQNPRFSEAFMKVRVDQDACVGDETCISLCPDLFEMDGEAARAKMEDVPETLQESCREAADACPVEAIIIDE